jgi:hypothetical protein
MSKRSYIFSFSTLSKRLRPPWGAIGAIGIVLLVNLACSLAPKDGQLPSPYFPRHEISKKYMTLKARESAGAALDVFFIGSSVADMGFDVVEFEDEMRRSGAEHLAFNMGINGAGPLVFSNLVEHLLIPGHDVKYVVYGISLVELNSSSPYMLEDQEKFMDSSYLEGKRDTIYIRGLLKRTLFKSFELFRLRDILWPNFYTEERDTWLKLRLKGEFYKSEFAGQQRITDPERNWSYARSVPLPARRVERLTSLLGDYDIEGYNTQELLRLIRLCKANGIKLILVNMPVIQKPSYLTDTVYMNMISSKSGENPSKIFDERFSAICVEYKVDCLDYGGNSGLPVTDFSDPLHLYHTGAAKLSRSIAKFIVKIDRGG